jgi:hypothetical protein
MKKPQGIDDLASRLTEAATAPLVPVAPSPEERPARPKRIASVSVFLRLPQSLHARLEGEAINRTKATGRGVTVQQIILERLAGDA